MSGTAHLGYDFLKRVMDIIIGAVLGIVSLILYPLVILAIKLEDGGEILSFQKRVGMNNKIITIVKFRTMTVANDNAEWGNGKNKVTRVGALLRKSRIDELPQLWNVLKGDVSLIGPRPEFERPVKEYSEKIPYYNTRHLIKPGLSGWAQLYHERHPHHGVDIEETKNKLSYDLYYIKNRSFMLDLEVALKTIRTLLSRTGA
jgi:lipopolysaccharide/colanic/teichoic acid biosynthesis glycosyltransferase